MQESRRCSVFPAVIAVVLGALFSPDAAAGSRFTRLLDDGTPVVVDNWSSWSDTWAGNLAVLADRSTRDEGMWYRPTKGLIVATDRILGASRVFVNNNYVAWFYASYLQGVWTLDSSTGLFLHKRTGPQGFSDWSHNELLSGAASPQGQSWLYDSSPGIEYAMAFDIGLQFWIGASHHAGYAAPNGNFAVLADGVPNAFGLDGVVYASSTRLAGPVNGVLTVDIADANDSNGIQNPVDSQIAYVCRDADIKVVWRFKPTTAPVSPLRTFTWMWAHYSLDVDGYPCESAPGDQFPNQTWGEPTSFLSNVQSWVGPPSNAQPPNVIYPLNRGVQCDKNVNIRYTAAPTNDTFMMWGENTVLAPNTPKWTIKHKVDAAFGTPIPWANMYAGNETADGVWGGGFLVDATTWTPSDWHVTTFTIATK